MRKAIRALVFGLLLAAAYTACKRAGDEKRAEEAAPDSVTLVYNSLQDSVTVAWNEITETEDTKLSDMKRLLQEITYTPNYDKARHDTLYKNLQEVYGLRFEAETMTSEQIDRYDSAVTNLQREILDFARSNPSFEEYPLIGRLSDSISAADQRTLFLRVRYDNFARDYNDFLKGNKGPLIQPSDTAQAPRQRPLFQLED